MTPDGRPPGSLWHKSDDEMHCDVEIAFPKFGMLRINGVTVFPPHYGPEVRMSTKPTKLGPFAVVGVTIDSAPGSALRSSPSTTARP